MSEVDMAEEIPNGDDSAFEDPQQSSGERQERQEAHPANTISTETDTVYVATSQGLLVASEQYQEVGNKTTHIVIHDQGVIESGLKSPSTPIPPPTPATPLSRDRGFKYQWDENVDKDILPVRCKTTNGDLHKNRFGSGNNVKE